MKLACHTIHYKLSHKEITSSLSLKIITILIGKMHDKIKTDIFSTAKHKNIFFFFSSSFFHVAPSGK